MIDDQVSTSQRDPEKDSIAIGADVLKHAATIAGLVATICTTFLLANLQEAPPGLWILVTGIVLLFLVAGSSVFALGNVAFAVRKGEYGVTPQVRFAFSATYIAFGIGFLCLIVFTVINAKRLPSQKTGEAGDAVKMYVEGYAKDTVQTLQRDLNNMISEGIQTLFSQVDAKLPKIVEEHDKMMRQYIDDKLKGIAPAEPSGSAPTKKVE
jgi:hypothetical protein